MSEEQTFGQATGAPQDATSAESSTVTLTTTDTEDRAPEEPQTPEHQQESARKEWEEQQAVQNKPWFKKRVDKLTYQRREAERLLQAERERNDKLQNMLNRSPGNEAENDQQNIVPPPVSSQKPRPDDFDSDYEYFEALSDWKLTNYQMSQEAKKQRDQQLRQQRENQEQQEQFDSWFRQESNRAMMTGEQNYMDWDQVVLPVINQSMPVSFGAEILQADNPSDVLYHVCKNQQELTRIMQIQSPVKRALALGKIDSDIQASRKKQNVSNAPPVMNPVRGTTTTPTAPDPKDTASWIRARRAEKAKRRG